MFINLPKRTLIDVKQQLDPDYDELGVKYLELISSIGKQVLNDKEIPRGYSPSRVRVVLRPYLKPLGYRFGYLNKGDEKLWGFRRVYA